MPNNDSPFILFLDIDGVIATAKSYMTEVDKLDRGCMSLLNQVLDRYPFNIVVHSTWKHLRTLEQLQDVLKELHAPVIETTVNLRHRGHEIALWLRENRRDDRYLVLDDTVVEIEPLIPSANLVHVKPSLESEGLTQAYIDEALQKLEAMETPTPR